MRKEHVVQLRDPVTLEELELQIYTEDGDHVMEGELRSRAHAYPIIAGVPRLLFGAYKVDLLKKHALFFTMHHKHMSVKLQNERKEAFGGEAHYDEFIKHQLLTGDTFSYEWNEIYEENYFFDLISIFYFTKCENNTKRYENFF